MTKKLTDITRLRNVGISAHIDSGKTTLTERMLFYCGRIHRMRDVRGDDGGATMDFDPIEKRRGITIASAATHVDWSGHHFNIIDTPGHVDFSVEVERSLRVLDGAVLVLCAVGGVQSQTITVDRQMRRYGVPRIALINKMDRTGANPDRVIAQLRDRLNTHAVAIQLPIGAGESFIGVIDLITMQALYFEGQHGEIVRCATIPNELFATAESARAQLVETLALLDDRLMEVVVNGEQPSVEELKRVLRAATLARKLTPVLMASAYKNQGVQPVLDAIKDFLPDPSQRVVDAEDLNEPQQDQPPRRVQLRTDANAPAVVMAFKTVVQKFGQLTFLRLYQGQLAKGDTLKNVRTGKPVRFGRLVRMHSDKREEIDAACAGDIIAVVGIDCASGDTFVGNGCNVRLENIVAADPVVRLSIAPEKRDDLDRLSKSLDRFRREDPTFHVIADSETGETQIAGMGQLHLEVYAERLRDECECPCILGRPSVTYKERPTVPVDFHHRFKKQNGGQGQFAQITGRLEPLPPDADESFVFEDRITGGRLLASYIAAARDGVRHALTNGPLDGYEMVGVKLTLTDGQQHEKDSSEWVFQLCAAEAMRKVVLPRCRAELLEPIMQVDIETPPEFVGKVTGHLTRLRGVVKATELDGPLGRIQASAPLAELFDFASQLRSITQGAGTFSMTPHEYLPVPTGVARQVLRSAG